MEKRQRCIVKIPDSTLREHVLEVEASSLYDAVGQGMAGIQSVDPKWKLSSYLDAVVKVEILNPAANHTVRIKQIQQWLNSSDFEDDLATIVRKNRVRHMLGLPTNDRAQKAAARRR